MKEGLLKRRLLLGRSGNSIDHRRLEPALKAEMVCTATVH